MKSLLGIRAASAAPPAGSPTSAEGTGVCRNCGAAAPGAYCPACGQETSIALPTLRAFMRDAAGRYVALDGRMWRTLYGLLFRPGFLTREFFAGRRRRYIRPARLFLVLSIVAFATLRFTADAPLFNSSDADGKGVHLVDPDEADEPSQADAKPGAEKQGQADGATSTRAPETPKADVRKNARKKERFDGTHDVGFSIGPDFDLHVGISDAPGLGVMNERIQSFNHLSRKEKSEVLRAGVWRFGPYAMIVLLPLFALLMKVAYLGRSRRYPLRQQRYTAHLVFGAHNHAFMFALVTVFALVNIGLVRVLLAIWAVIYLARSMKVVYGGRWSGVVFRSALVGFLYLVLFMIAVAGLIVAAALIR